MPDEFPPIENYFSKAWEKPFEGLSHSFTEYELLKLISMGKSKSIIDIYNGFVKKYPNMAKSKSQIYRIIESMESEGLIKTMKEGKSKILSLTEKGYIEIGMLTRYVFNFLREKVIIEGLWTDILEIVVPITGCLRKGQVLFSGPVSYGVGTLWNSCRKCPNPVMETPLTPIFLALPHTDTTQPPLEEVTIQTIDTPDPYDWLPKKESVDIVSAMSLITKFGSRIVDEIYRVLKSGGYALIIEPVKTTPNIILQMYNQIIATDKLETAKFWSVKKTEDNLKDKNEITELLREKFGNAMAIQDTLMHLVICRKN